MIFFLLSDQYIYQWWAKLRASFLSFWVFLELWSNDLYLAAMSKIFLAATWIPV